MSFVCANENMAEESFHRKDVAKNILPFGVSFLDDALVGIFPDDLILLGAPTGVGKTQLCVNIAMANMENGKKVHMIALEASQFEIERRLKYQQVAECFFKDPQRPKLSYHMDFTNWYLGRFDKEFAHYHEYVEKICSTGFSNLFTFYKANKFDVSDLVLHFSSIADETDLIILDHVHYLDWDEPNDNRAIKEIAKTVRELAIVNQKPVILIAHLRKKDRGNKELVAGVDEFHGSSDLVKIATKVITVAPGDATDDNKFITYFRIPKNRMNGAVTRFIAATAFDPKKGSYDDEYEISRAGVEKFQRVDDAKRPYWANRASASFHSSGLPDSESESFKNVTRKNAPKKVFNPSERY